eukprot:767239-Hanusia_phi.AAC.2
MYFKGAELISTFLKHRKVPKLLSTVPKFLTNFTSFFPAPASGSTAGLRGGDGLEGPAPTPPHRFTWYYPTQPGPIRTKSCLRRGWVEFPDKDQTEDQQGAREATGEGRGRCRER